MQCPKCKNEMEQGAIDDGWWSRWSLKWGKMFSGLVKTTHNALLVTAWRCPKCGKVELTTEREK